ncbi:hypothetical protein EVAR_22565_1 [Eumeta japonica]|uniref:Uncharacterized protein n=1 Tax=Eumeta variegata TaxID=151549 RepID=A0A4C1U7I6_EUMVA|nr:hypothetical protein EVAR_22565_1 [Eumeta japonica]
MFTQFTQAEPRVKARTMAVMSLIQPRWRVTRVKAEGRALQPPAPTNEATPICDKISYRDHDIFRRPFGALPPGRRAVCGRGGAALGTRLPRGDPPVHSPNNVSTMKNSEDVVLAPRFDFQSAISIRKQKYCANLFRVMIAGVVVELESNVNEVLIIVVSALSLHYTRDFALQRHLVEFQGNGIGATLLDVVPRC